MNEIKIGQTYSKEIVVDMNMLAMNVGSGDVSVYATPMMIALMEEVSANCLLMFLDEGMTSVGTSISTTHISATPVGMKVYAIAKIVEVEGKKVSFEIKAFDAEGLIGEATHNRFIVNREKFNEKASLKTK